MTISVASDAMVLLVGYRDMLAAFHTLVAVAALQARLESSPAVMAALAAAALRHAALGTAQRRHAVQPRRRLRRRSDLFQRPPPRGASRRVILTRVRVVRTRRGGVGSGHVHVIGAVFRLADEALTVGTQVPSTEHQRRRCTLAALVSGDVRPARRKT